MSEKKLASYLADAKPNPMSNRAPWYKNTAPTYLGVFMWFVFWNELMNVSGTGGGIAQGILIPIVAVISAALLCHFLFFLAPATYGMKTGLPLYVIGSSTFGEKGAVVLPGLLMGILQFGWLAVNANISSGLLHETLTFVPVKLIMIAFAAGATFVGLKGIQYVAKISTYLPLIPLGILIFLLYKTLPTLGNFDPAMFKAYASEAKPIASGFTIFAAIIAAMVGYFATAGAAGVDIGTAARDKKDVQLGGLVGISLVISVVGILVVLIVAGAYGNPEFAKALMAQKSGGFVVTDMMAVLVGAKTAKILMFLLAFAAFSGGCFSAMIAVNSFKTMLPKINPNVSASVGALFAIVLAVTGLAREAITAFSVVGACFGPICGAITAEFILNKGKWCGSRKGINLAGLLAWAAGFTVGVIPILANVPALSFLAVVSVPMASLVAGVVGGIVYFIAAKLRLESSKL